MSKSVFFFCTILLISIVKVPGSSSFSSGSVIQSSNETDRVALLAIRAQITHDPFGITTSWNDSVHFCNWAGVTCGHLHQRVVNLNLSSLKLVGSLSPCVGNMTFLTGINLELNHFHGRIPDEIGRLFRLKHLNLSNNSFSGEIPANISHCTNLLLLQLGWNSLIGKIPFQLGSLQKLERMQLHYNNFTGQIPETFGNLSSIKTLSLAGNNFQGTIPEGLGQLKTLNFLELGQNQLSGTIPPLIFNLSSLITLSFPYNMLDGTLPSDLGLGLPSLRVLNIGHNLFTGKLPKSLSNASNLVEFDIPMNSFEGKVSIDFGGMPNLCWLILASNPLGTGDADDLSFSTSLTKCRNLKVLDLSDCQFGGALPNAIANLSANILSLRLGGNCLSGSILTGVQTLVKLTELQLRKNKLTGSIPESIGNLQMLRLLDLSENSLSGSIPSSLSNITRLYALYLGKNNLTGKIPLSFGNFGFLQELDLSQNHLNGTIPRTVMSLVSLTVSLNLSHNQLSGSLPSEVGDLKNLGRLDVSRNMLSGEIPSSIGRCLTLERLSLGDNIFEGPIPRSFGYLRGLQDLDLSHNNLSGQVPGFLQNISLKHLDLSFNQFGGQVPTGGVFKHASAFSVAGNSKLCGGIQELLLPACPEIKSSKTSTSPGLKLMIPLLSGLLGLVLVMSILITFRIQKTKVKAFLASSSSTNFFMKVTYEDLFRGTDGFSPSNLIGTGSVGSVYKGILEDGTIVAVKVIHLHQERAFKSFLAECGALRNIKHRNLVNTYTACCTYDFQGEEFRALVSQFFPNGSLERWLHPSPITEGMSNNELKVLGLLPRVGIAIDVASALDYLHNHCYKPIVHCDLKPANILLDTDMRAHVSDYGFAKYFSAISKHHSNESSSGPRGTIGYAAPEYGMGGKVSSYGDVYSFGILLLEMFTGKRPTDSMFKDGLTLHSYAKMAIPERINEILDPVIQHTGQQEEEEEEEEEEGDIIGQGDLTIGRTEVDQTRQCLMSIIGIGIACSVDSERERMEIEDVVKELQLIRDILLASERNYSSTSGSMRYEGSSSRSAASNWQSIL